MPLVNGQSSKLFPLSTAFRNYGDVFCGHAAGRAKIEGSRLLNEEGHDYLLSLDRNTTILFHCHHGIRSQSAAEYFLHEKGFRNLYNLRGGIDAWSQLVDPSVPRY
jgi:monothiol glutaredoxin